MLKNKLEKILEYLKSELSRLRVGRVSVDLVENVEIEAYDSKTPLNQLATLSTPEPRMILIRPWDKAVIKNIESAMRRAISDINPVVESDQIRIFFPPPTEERRRELVKEAGKLVEEARIKIRRVREEALEELKDRENKKEISEDEFFRSKDEAQKIIDEFNGRIEESGKKKEEEIMSI